MGGHQRVHDAVLRLPWLGGHRAGPGHPATHASAEQEDQAIAPGHGVEDAIAGDVSGLQTDDLAVRFEDPVAVVTGAGPPDLAARRNDRTGGHGLGLESG